MDTVLYYRLIDAVRDSLDRAGRHGYRLHRAERHERWLDLGWLQDHLDEAGHDAVPLLWGERPLSAHDTLKATPGDRTRELWRSGRSGEILLRDDALVAAVTFMPDDGIPETLVVLGERAEGALQRMVDGYTAYADRCARGSDWIRVIGGEHLPRARDLDWDALILAPAFRKELHEQVTSFFALREEYRRMKIPHRRGLLFTGPPGNGKTSALRVIASVLPEPFFICTVNESTEKDDLNQAFDQSALAAPSILCFEDVDSFFSKEGLLSHFLNRIDGLAPLDGVLLLATTNHPEELDSALTERPSRFDRIFHFGNPAAEERRRYLIEGFGPVFEEPLVAATEGFSMAQLKEVRVSACLEAIHRGLPGPTIASALQAVERLRGQRSVVEQDLDPQRTIAGFQNRSATK